MKKALCILLLGCVIACVFDACKCSGEQKPRRRPMTKQEMVEYNRQRLKKDSLLISYISDSLGLDKDHDERGLWLTVREPGDSDGKLITESSNVTIGYVISDFVQADTFYTSLVKGPKRFNVTKNDEPFGLCEALIGLRKGAKATVVLLPDKAYGLLGDDNRIVGRHIIRYDFEVLDVE